MRKPLVQKKISEGSYGCIFRPGYSCDGKSLNSDKYITKIQKEQETSTREADISALIRTIDHYADFFSPILEEPCLIDLATVEDDEIKKCGFINDAKKNGPVKYETNKIKYVGKQTLADHSMYLFKQKPKQILKNLFDMHIHLLDGYKKLLEKGIIHFDVKENNIVCKDKTHLPIIIDFGLSFQIANIEKDNYQYAFFTYGPDYGPWCIDICFLTYMANKLGEDWQGKPVEQKHINKVLFDFFSENYAIRNLFTEEERANFQKRLTDEFTNKIVTQKFTWKQFADYLTKCHHSWDNYAVCITFLYIIKDMELESYQMMFPKLGEYMKLLKTIVLSLPEERQTIENTRETILKTLSNINRKENREIQKSIVENAKNPEKANEYYKNIMTTRMHHLKKEEKVYDVINKK